MSPTAVSSSTPDNQVEPGPGLSLLLVEDNEADSYLICRALRENPSVERVTRARDGIEALAMVDLGLVSPDLAFIDLHMPHMDGFKLLTAFANRHGRSFPMVVLTSSSAPSDAVRSRLRNAVQVVAKPDSVAEMYTALKTTIDTLCPLAPRAGAQRRGSLRLARPDQEDPIVSGA